MLERIVSQVEFEIGQIEHLFEAYADLLAQTRERVPGLVEIAAVASVLHSFYNGLENIFQSIAKGIDRDVPVGAQWHSDLLIRMTEATSGRGPVLTTDTAHWLADYLGFRHFYRHSYTFFLEWDELEKLVTPLTEVWERTRGEIQQFLGRLNESTGGQMT